MLHIALGAGMLLMSVIAAFTVYYFVEGPIKVEIIVEVEEKSEDELGCGLWDHLPVETSDITNIIEDYYMVLEPQWEWNKKYLTYTYTIPDKNRGIKIASQPDSYPVTDYYHRIPKRVLKDKSYKQTYLNKYKSLYPE